LSAIGSRDESGGFYGVSFTLYRYIPSRFQALIRRESRTLYKLGVLISIYRRDEPALFRRAITSILNQKLSTQVDLRIYLGVDGPIPDDLRAAIRLYQSDIYKLLWFEQNRGLACVLNDLISHREDEDFFFRMDPDDMSEPQRFELQLAFMLEHPNVDILGTDILEVDETSGTERVVRFAKSSRDAKRWISWRSPVAHPTVCFRARVFEKVHGYPPLRQCEDIAMWFECMKAGLVFDNLHKPLHRFKFGEDFWRRRSFLRPWAEFLIYTKGIWRLEGVTWKYVNPAARLFVRLAPLRFQRMLYSSSLRVTDAREREAVCKS
jgi:glycosyltransferase involved in cell wall biosynthesis